MRHVDNAQFYSIFLAAVLAALALLLAACGTSSVVTALEAVVATAETAVSVLSATGQIPAPVATEINIYLGDVGTAAAFAASELASTDSTAVKVTKIIQQFSMIAAPSLPPGTAQTIIAVVQAVTTAIAKFLAQITPAVTAKRAAVIPPKITISSSDARKLLSLRTRALAIAAVKK
ncbi:MAG: hypothetical protein ACREMY_03300 [bacterium]